MGKKTESGRGTEMKKMFKGKESFKEELAEGKAVKAGKITPKQYAKGEQSEKAKYAAGGVTKKFPTAKGMGSSGLKCGGKVKA